MAASCSKKNRANELEIQLKMLNLVLVVCVLSGIKMNYFKVLVLNGFHVPVEGGYLKLAQKVVWQMIKGVLAIYLDIVTA